MKKSNENYSNNEVLYKDVMLLDSILSGKWKGTYKGYTKENLERVIIYAEFDLEYKYVHTRIVNGCYISKDEKTGKETVVSYDEYMKTIKSLTETNTITYGSRGDQKKTGFINSPLKNKVNAAFQILYHIIDGADLDNGTYSEYESPSEPKEPENGRVQDYKLYEISHEEWRAEQDRVLRKRESVIKKEITGKGADRKVYYKYLHPMGDFIKEHFRQKDVKNILNTSAKEDLPKKNEIIDALVSDRNHDLIQRIRQLESEIGSLSTSEDHLSLSEIIAEKYKTALKLAMQLGDPNEMASLFVCYMDYLNQDNVLDYFASLGPLNGEDDNGIFLQECLSIIQKNATKPLESIEQSAKSMGSDWMDRLEKGLEDQITILRMADSQFLSDVLFMYAKICMNIFNFEKARDCFEECRDIYIKKASVQAIPNLITIYSNLSKLYSDWNQIDKAFENAQYAIDCMKSIEMSVINKSYVSLFYATTYNAISTIFAKQNNYDKVQEYLEKAYEAIAKEDDNDPNILSTQLMVSYNICVLEIKVDEYERAAEGLELILYKAMLLYAIDKKEQNLAFKLTVQSALSSAQMHIGKLTDAEDNALDALKEYDKLYEQNPLKYGDDRLICMLHLADIYDAKESNSDAESLYHQAKEEANELIRRGVSVAKTTLYNILVNLSGFYNKNGAHDKSIATMEEAIKICDDLLSLNPEYYIIEMIKVLNNLSIAYYQSGNIEEALQTCREAGSVCEELMDKEFSNPELLNYYYYKVLHDFSVMVGDNNA